MITVRFVLRNLITPAPLKNVYDCSKKACFMQIFSGENINHTKTYIEQKICQSKSNIKRRY